MSTKVLLSTDGGRHTLEQEQIESTQERIEHDIEQQDQRQVLIVNSWYEKNKEVGLF